MSRSVFVWIRILSSSYGLSLISLHFLFHPTKNTKGTFRSRKFSHISPKNWSQNKIRKQSDIHFWPCSSFSKRSKMSDFFASHLISDFPLCFYDNPFNNPITVFENHRKSLIQHCERSELSLHFEWTKINEKCQKWSILASF